MRTRRAGGGGLAGPRPPDAASRRSRASWRSGRARLVRTRGRRARQRRSGCSRPRRATGARSASWLPAPGRDLQERCARPGDRAAGGRRLQRPAHARRLPAGDQRRRQRAGAARARRCATGSARWLDRVRELRGQAAAEVARIAAARDEVAQIRAAAQARAAALARARAAQQASLAALRSRMAGWTAQVRAPAGRQPAGRQRRADGRASGSAASRSRRRS